MNPFSPLYFIKENKTRCVLLMFMLFLGFAAYLGGIYVTNPMDNWSLPIEYSEKAVRVIANTGDEEDFELFIKEAAESGKVQVLELGTFDGLNWKTIMGFESGVATMTFRSVEDFKVYCEYMDIECDFGNLKSGSMVMSDRFAKNRELEIGDRIDTDTDKNIYGEYTLDAVTKEDGYMQYFITDETDAPLNAILLGKEVDGRELYELAHSLQENHDIYVNDSMKEEIESQFNTFNTIYIFIIVLMSVILAVTINAVFVGMYQRRTMEFAVYRGIGISRRRIIGKIIGELISMDFIALVVGGVVFFSGLYLYNNLVLYPVGKYLRYYHPLALFGLVLCNLTVIIPLIVTRARQMLKTDICEF